MDVWKYNPAHDLGLTEAQRIRSLQREAGLTGLVARNLWWWFVRGYLGTCQRVTVEGRENLPQTLPFMLAANHASHLDALVLADGAVAAAAEPGLPHRRRRHVF